MSEAHTYRTMFLLAVLLLGACSTSAPGGGRHDLIEGENCTKDDDCKEGLLCKATVCRKACKNNQDCDELTQHCENDVCLPGSKLKCGNGVKEAGEDCDDGNNTAGDGCSSSCTLEAGYSCEENQAPKSICTLKCGNGVKETGEECDDNNSSSGDGCDSECKIEANYECNDGNPSVCVCKTQFTGDKCQECQPGYKLPSCQDCAENYYGPTCTRCYCDHGRCESGIDGRGCLCESGWSGTNCDECEEGYYGRDCQQCPGRGTEGGICSGHGECESWIDGQGCICSGGWEGINCEKCQENHYSNDCRPCPATAQGICNNHGTCSGGTSNTYGCDCESEWDGEKCEKCKSGYYGSDCKPCPKGQNGRICSGHGSCDEGLNGSGCTCVDNWFGEACEYETVNINGFLWTKTNMRSAATDNSAGIYAPNGEEANVARYGHLYTWEAAKNVCPNGWRLPTSQEFGELLRYVQNHQQHSGNVFLGLIAKSTAWSNFSEEGTDEFGFGGLPAGSHCSDSYFGVGLWGYWWSATEHEATVAYTLLLGNSQAFVDKYGTPNAFSVRCLKDSP